MQYAQIGTEVERIAQRAGEFLMEEWARLRPEDVRLKSANQLVSYVDEQAERLIRKQLKAIWPQAGFLGEEGGQQDGGGGARWIIDPLDGTTNFIHGIPGFSVSIALEAEGALQVGVIMDPVHNHLYQAVRGGGAYCNGSQLRVSHTAHLQDALLATGFPYYDYQYLPEYLQLLGYFMQHSQGLRRIGSAALDLAFVASGRFEAFFEYGLKSWDVAAGILLVEEAGGVATDFGGSASKRLYGGEMLAGNPKIHPALQAAVASHLPGT